ncbi:pentatricopeptide repeat-containing protein [Tanacetum coccineum]|uniref:Pentatricopeptide repeat-containing protein n=1 Tax=Tanacetum coccineum TaxID=301880 RepID=A0ABQ5F3W5_9ASTR
MNMYLKSGEFGYAHNLFDEMSERNVVSWNMLISGYAKTGRYEYAKRVFSEARGMNVGFSKFTYGSVLSVCGKTGDLELGRVVHGMIVVSGVGVDVDAFLSNLLVGMYSKCGRVDIARVVFEKCGELDEVSWSSMIAGYVKGGLYDEMLRVLVKMHRCGVGFSSYVLGSVLYACCRSFGDLLIWGKLLHSCSVKLGWDLDVVVGTVLLDMYAKVGDINDAISVFGLLRDKNVVMFNAMISFRPASCGWDGQKPSEFTFSSMIRSCIAYKDLEYGKQIHAHVCENNLQSDEYIGSALIDMYSLWGLMTDSIRCFNSTKKQDIVIWTSAIVGHAQNGEYERALVIFCELLKNELKPDEFTVSTVLSACANLGGVRCGEQIQNYSVKSGIVKSSVVVNSLVYMYAKSGDKDSANQAFDLADKSDVVSMGIAPNDVAFLGVLTACSHGGLVEEGLRYYETMKRDYNITPTEKHCACIVDLFGRAGRLSDAKSFITNSSFSDAPVMWRSLLSSCRIHKNMEIGKQVAERLTELDPQSSSSYVLLYNIYNDAKMEPQATKIRDLMTNQRIKKEPGLSWIEVGNRVHSFVVGDNTPSNEKLAVTLGLLSLPLSAPVRVMKNLRVCQDCHNVMKLISKVEKREIVLRDPIRFHRFRDGICTCGDYWSYVATELPTKDSSLQFNMMALIFLEESDYSGVLLDLLSEKDNVAALLLEKFVSILLGRSKGRSLNLNPKVVAEAFMSVEDPLVIVCPGYLSPKIHAPCAIFVDINKSKEEIMSVLFPRKNTRSVDTSSHSVNVGTTLEPPSQVNSNLNANPVNICKAEGKMKEKSLKEMSESTNGEKGDLQSTFPSESTTKNETFCAEDMILVEGEHSKLNALSDTVDQSPQKTEHSVIMKNNVSQQGKQMVASECSSSSKTEVEQTSDHALVEVELESQSGDGNTLMAKNKKGNQNKGKKGKLIKGKKNDSLHRMDK